MARFNTRTTRPAGGSPVTTTGRTTPTYEGATGHLRDAKSELFLLAVSNLVGVDTFYEKGAERDDRFEGLVRRLAIEDPEWTAGLLKWLRGEGNMRTAALVGAAEFTAERLTRAAHGHSRQVIASVLQRADEPGELLGYWTSRYGRNIPKPVKRGIADAVRRLYSERCVTPDTLVLKRDLTWVRAGELLVGDELVGFDEEVRGKGKGQSAKMRVSVVTATRNAMLETVKVVTDRGETSVSVDHMFVVTNNSRNREWRRAGDLKVADKLVFFGAPWAVDYSYEAGWLAGYLDGEGYINHKSVGVGQNVGPTLEHSKVILKHLGFQFSIQQYEPKGNRHTKEVLKILGGRYEAMRLLGTVQPIRLSRDRLWVDGDLVSKGPHVAPGSSWANVTAVEPLGMRENVTMSTSARTFIADGFLAHNSLLKYDTDSKGYRFGDVLNLVHASPAPDRPWQGDLFRHALDRRHGNGEDIPARLVMLRQRAALMSVPVADRRGLLLDRGLPQDAGMTWEALAGWLQGPMDAAAWEAVIPSMGLMALIRNLRNFDEAGVSDEVAARVASKISDAEEVRRSRVFPFRFWAAYKHAPSLRWAHALEQALGHALANVPALPGRTLILVDRSPSMFPGYGYSTANRSDIPLAEQAAVFGSALAARAAAPTLVEFGMTSKAMDVPKGGSVLRLIERFGQISGTDIPSAVKQHYDRHDRVVIVTDEQTRPGWLPSNCHGAQWGGMPETRIDDLVPQHVPVYMWNMAGYKAGAMPSGGGNRHAMGGLTDSAFAMIPLLDAGRNAVWPWEQG
ncbi:TROVE domain-containing protein [Streptomyces sp. NPDC002889]|uniref:TROVE domain-containing protein n=1 Tax=Streptomyces sp. NPDC002889 TaxID=3364669 RepID=UPI0036B196B9